MQSYWLIVTSENDHVLQLTAVSASEEAQATATAGKPKKRQPTDPFITLCPPAGSGFLGITSETFTHR